MISAAAAANRCLSPGVIAPVLEIAGLAIVRAVAIVGAGSGAWRRVR